MWLGEIEDDPVIRETLAKRIEEALRAIEEADAPPAAGNGRCTSSTKSAP
jgi:hypothetical protein